MSESRDNDPGCGWFVLFALIILSLTSIEFSVGRVAAALERIATAAEHPR